MSDQSTSPVTGPTDTSPVDLGKSAEAEGTSRALPVVPTTESTQGMEAEGAHKGSAGGTAWLAEVGFFRMLGLLIALALLCVVGMVTAGDRFASSDNLLTILRLSTVIGVVAIGMTFVITGGGIDLSVGAILALSSVWATTLATREMAVDVHWSLMVFTAIAVGAGCGLVNGILIAYGKVVAFIATLAMLVSARGLAEIISQKKTQIATDVPGFFDFFTAKPLGIDMSIWVFAAVAVVGWVLLNRTTFGRRTFAVGGNPEAARLAGINVRRHTVLLYVLVGVCSAIGALLIIARTTTGSSTHGMLLELDAIAAVVIGGTLLAGGRGTITGTVLGVLIFTTLTNVFTLNNRDNSEQSLLKGVIIVAAVLLQQWLASRKSSS
ncbi:ribose transport system permease protein [Nocardioides sp. J9]|uniref:ABC transporter permease n=1 Tax=Nocardioides sp. J9 TaxID=935844 RepID=UPI0011A65E70|nr:ABC transporter permease [Nocardioides sp. J9]TWG99006.1 ribose transport system permease protein [Nocardioides sp. J9]